MAVVATDTSVFAQALLVGLKLIVGAAESQAVVVKFVPWLEKIPDPADTQELIASAQYL